jgi:hypothetical protein
LAAAEMGRLLDKGKAESECWRGFAARWKSGLLIRRSLVRVQVGEPEYFVVQIKHLREIEVLFFVQKILKSFKNWPLPEFCRNEKIQTKRLTNFWRFWYGIYKSTW